MTEREEQEVEYWRWDEGNWRDPDKDWKDAEIITAGVDVGSVSSQAAILADGELFAYANTRSGYNSRESATKVMNMALEAVSDMKLEHIHYVVGTGYGRVRVPFANRAITEIACHARGANFMYGPSVRTVMDMGGQDLKAISCDEKGKVLNFIMSGDRHLGGEVAPGCLHHAGPQFDDGLCQFSGKEISAGHSDNQA